MTRAASVSIRAAGEAEAAALSALAMRSKAHWGYDEAFMVQCRAELTVGPAPIADGRVAVAERIGRIVGFYQIDPAGNRALDVGLFFVEPDAIGTGVGRTLWAHLEAAARSLGARRITIAADPDAAGFYEAMGAVRKGEVPSFSIPGRMLPALELSLAD